MSGLAMIWGAVAGGLCGSVFHRTIEWLISSLGLCVMGIMSLFGLGYMHIRDASIYPQLDKQFRRDRYGVYQFSTAGKRYGLFWGWSPTPFVAHWSAIPKDMRCDMVLHAANENLHLVTSKKTLAELFTAAYEALGSTVNYTHAYEYVTLSPARYGNDPSVRGTRKIRAMLEAWPAQDKLARLVVQRTEDSPNDSCVVCIYGRPGTGKSTVASIAASALHARLVDVNIFANETALEAAYQAMQPSISNRVVFRFDEIDSVVDEIIERARRARAATQVQVQTVRDAVCAEKFETPYPKKRDWTSTLDRISEGFYPHAVFVFTTNRNISDYDKEDDSLFRSGRFDICEIMD